MCLASHGKINLHPIIKNSSYLLFGDRMLMRFSMKKCWGMYLYLHHETVCIASTNYVEMLSFVQYLKIEHELTYRSVRRLTVFLSFYIMRNYVNLLLINKTCPRWVSLKLNNNRSQLLREEVKMII